MVIPLEEVRQYLIDIKRKEEAKEQSIRKGRRIRILIENSLIQKGEQIFLKNSLPDYLQFEEDNPVFQAEITGKLGRDNSVKWAKDDKEYSISSLTHKIFKNNHPDKKDPGAVHGNLYWVNEAGKSLWEVAEEYLEKNT